MFDYIFDLRKLSVFALLIFLSFLNSGCSDFRQAIGKEKFIPNEYSFISTPRLIMPPEFANVDNIIEDMKANLSNNDEKTHHLKQINTSLEATDFSSFAVKLYEDCRS